MGVVTALFCPWRVLVLGEIAGPWWAINDCLWKKQVRSRKVSSGERETRDGNVLVQMRGVGARTRVAVDGAGRGSKFSSLIISAKEESTLSAKAPGPRSGRQGPRTEEKVSGTKRTGMGLGPAAQGQKQDLEGEGPMRLIGRPSDSRLRLDSRLRVLSVLLPVCLGRLGCAQEPGGKRPLHPRPCLGPQGWL